MVADCRMVRAMTCALLCLMLLAPGVARAQETSGWLREPLPAASIHLAEPDADEIVVVINDNALGGNHAGLFAGNLLIDPAGSYMGMRERDKAWPGPSLADYAHYQTTDGPKVRFYRFRPDTQTFKTIASRMRDAGPTPPLFCAVTVQNLLAGLAPFPGIESVGFTTPSALGRRLDTLVGQGGTGECQRLDGTPC